MDSNPFDIDFSDLELELPDTFMFDTSKTAFDKMFGPKEQTRIEMAALAAMRGDLSTAERFRTNAGYGGVSDDDNGGMFLDTRPKEDA